MGKAVSFWDGAAEKYAKSPIRDMDAYIYTLDRTRSYLSEGDDVLEIGCGTGSTALLLANSVGRMTATDMSPKMIEIAKGKAKDASIANLQFSVAQASTATSKPEAYDVVLAFNLIHLVPNAKDLVSTIHKSLKPGGLFISKTVCKPQGFEALGFRLIMAALPLIAMTGKVPTCHFLRVQDHDEMILSQGFEIIETGNHPAAPPCRYVVARKV